MQQMKKEIHFENETDSEDLSIKIKLQSNIFDDTLLHVELVHPDITTLPKRVKLSSKNDMQQKLSFGFVQPFIVPQRYFYSPNVKRKERRRSKNACLKCHETKKKCVRDGNDTSKCLGCVTKGIECVSRLDGRSTRYIQGEKEHVQKLHTQNYLPSAFNIRQSL
eukprot:74464_1